MQHPVAVNVSTQYKLSFNKEMVNTAESSK